MKTGYIYVHINKINGKAYVGQTIMNPETRWRNGRGYKNSPKFFKAIIKYGWDNFEHKIIGEFSENMLDYLERYYINIYKSLKNGYNIEDGGNKNKHLSEETKKKISIKSKKILNQPDIKNKMSVARIGKPPSNKGKPMPEHVKKILHNNEIYSKISKSKYKKLLNVDTGEIFESATAASKKYGNGIKTNMCKICKGERETAGGYHWKYI